MEVQVQRIVKALSGRYPNLTDFQLSEIVRAVLGQGDLKVIAHIKHGACDGAGYSPVLFELAEGVSPQFLEALPDGTLAYIAKEHTQNGEDILKAAVKITIAPYGGSGRSRASFDVVQGVALDHLEQLPEGTPLYIQQ